MASYPTCNALLVYDQIIEDAVTGKSSLIGILETVHAAALPVLVPQFAVYAKVTDVLGHYEIELILMRLDDQAELGAISMSLESSDRMAARELMFRLPGTLLERRGRYEFRLLADGKLVALKSFTVVP